ncbi:MAG: PAS domain S-box protein [Candidatus Omnitrophota bacterium]
MTQEDKTNEELKEEINLLYKRIAELETINIERKQVGDVLRISEKKFRTIFNNSTDGIIITDLESKKFHDANQSMCGMLGYNLEELKSLGVEDIHPKEQLANVLERIEEQSKDSLVPAADLPVIKKGGSIFYANVLGTKMNLLGKDYMVAIFRDVTGRRRAEEALRSSNVRFQELFNNMSSGVAIYEAIDEGRDFIIKDINKSGERNSRVRREEIIGKGVLEVFPGVKKIGLFEVFLQVWKSGISLRHPVSFYHDGRLSEWVENYVYKLPSGEIVAVYDDYTERKEAEAEVEKHLQELEIFYKAAIGREERIIELKKEIECLKSHSGNSR